MAAIVLIVPSGYRKPRAVSTPPPNSDALAPMAHGVPGFIPSDSSQPAVPCSPKPPNQPKDFCEPCPLNSPPTVSRKISSPRSLIMCVFSLVFACIQLCCSNRRLPEQPAYIPVTHV